MKTVHLEKGKDKLSLSIYAMETYEDFDSIADYLIKKFSAQVIETLDGPAERVWTFLVPKKNANAGRLSVYDRLTLQNNPYSNSLYGAPGTLTTMERIFFDMQARFDNIKVNPVDIVPRIEKTDTLITALSEKYQLQTSNPKETIRPYLNDAISIKTDTPYINDEGYYYYLSQYGDMSIASEELSILVYGFGYWDGSAIRDYPLLSPNGFYAVADQCDEDGNMVYVAYNASVENGLKIWLSKELDNGFIPVYDDFTQWLEAVLDGSFLHYVNNEL
ncbi:hypothetical protein OGH69_02565 [Flavobacterium sp. MFBS3-15]|uniref:hypothetical protein n=1 Tax=Flavobacterium sp. MFBS3-15 TaxID=2989816 RepID=UPI00223583BC|nr:hypothetical protein [Flavobacterium sp. MFBS3-15]MCW4467834.1 hypothetical protein [Flavobacterium sp. MFBS3-15]